MTIINVIMVIVKQHQIMKDKGHYFFHVICLNKIIWVVENVIIFIITIFCCYFWINDLVKKVLKRWGYKYCCKWIRLCILSFNLKYESKILIILLFPKPRPFISLGGIPLLSSFLFVIFSSLLFYIISQRRWTLAQTHPITIMN